MAVNSDTKKIWFWSIKISQVFHSLVNSWLFTEVTNFQLELPALEGHQHPSKVIPRDFTAIDNDEWRVVPFGHIAFDSPPHRLFGNLKSAPVVRDVLDRNRATYFFDQAPQQGKQRVFGIANYLELIACRAAVLKFKGFNNDDIAHQACLEMKLVWFSGAVRDLNGFKPEVLKIFQPTAFSHVCVKAKSAKLSIALIERAVIDDVVAGRDRATRPTMNRLHVN